MGRVVRSTGATKLGNTAELNWSDITEITLKTPVKHFLTKFSKCVLINGVKHDPYLYFDPEEGMLKREKLFL